MLPPDPPIEIVSRLDIAIESFDWLFLKTYAEKIDAHWAAAKARKPRLFDGRVFMMHRADIIEANGQRVLDGAVFETPYRGFLSWRDFDYPDRSIGNCFSMAALRSSDGAYMLGKMGAHTANSGRLYFAAGTPDLGDVRDGKLDLEGSAMRELTEETGLGPDDVTLADEWALVKDGPFLACMRPTQSPLTAKELVARVADFLKQDKDPELDGLVPIYSEADFEGKDLPTFMLLYLRYCFSR